MWIIFALLATVFFGARGVLYQWTSQKKINRNLLLFGVFFVGFVISALGTVVFEHTWYGWADITVGLALGFGSFAANVLLHKGFSVGKDQKIVVFDFGGGTHDVSILELGDGVFEVLSTDGDTHLGGDDVDEKIINWLAEEFKSEENMDLRKDPMSLQRLKEAAEKAKIELSASPQTEINLPYITATASGPKHLVRTLTKAKFEQLIDDLIKRTIAPCKSALKAADLSTSDIDEIILVGG